MLNTPKETEIYRPATSSGQKEPKQESSEERKTFESKKVNETFKTLSFG